MNPGGGHQKNNPHLGKKSKFRGDKQREKKAGRKRIGKEYRQKGVRETPLKKVNDVSQDFNEMEYNILFNLNKKGSYGDHSADLIKIIRARHVKPKQVDEVLQLFSAKITKRDWGRIYPGDDGKTYISLNIEKISFIQSYIELNRI